MKTTAIDVSGAARRRSRWALALSGLLLVSGCTEQTWWDARGSWSGRVTLPGEVEVQREAGLTDIDAGSDEGRVRLCELSDMDLSLTFVPIEKDRPAAIRVRVARPLCHPGATQITGGSVLIWTSPAGDPHTLTAVHSNAWTVTGQIDITSYSDLGLPDLDAGESASTEHAEGTFSLTATNGAGEIIRIEGGSFELSVEASRVKLSFS
ncbi:MAG: hypothetical protein ACYC6F_02930 [Longimicrobiales bacterium]